MIEDLCNVDPVVLLVADVVLSKKHCQFSDLNILLQYIEHYKRFRLYAKSISRVYTTKYQNTRKYM